MPKIIIVIEDRIDVNGNPEIFVDVKARPNFDGNKPETLSDAELYFCAVSQAMEHIRKERQRASEDIKRMVADGTIDEYEQKVMQQNFLAEPNIPN